MKDISYNYSCKPGLHSGRDMITNIRLTEVVGFADGWDGMCEKKPIIL